MSRAESRKNRKSPNDLILERLLEPEGDEQDAYWYVIEYGYFNSDWLTFWRDNTL
jgi:hypothetical protein